MSVPIVETPKELKDFIKDYKSCFSKKQYNHFKNLVTGLIVSDKKNIQEINDCFDYSNQSSMNRFVNGNWNMETVNNIAINQAKQYYGKLTQGILICDPTFLHKTGKKMEKANYHHSGKTKKKEWGHFLVNTMFYNEKIHFPIRADIYLRKEDSDENNPYLRLRDIFINQIHYAIRQGLPIKLIMADAGLQAEYVCQEIKSLGLEYVIGARITTKISIKKQKRITIKEYLDSLSKKDYSRFKIDGEKFYIHTVEVYNRKIGKELLIITYKKNDDCIKIYTSNILNKSDEVLMHILLKRWNIEVVHRDEKQHLGLEDYQVRKFGGIQRVVLVVLVAYVVLILNASRQCFLHCFYRKLKTIGEGCRYFRLIATKGRRWIRKMAREMREFANILNRFVFVKNAKV